MTDYNFETFHPQYPKIGRTPCGTGNGKKFTRIDVADALALRSQGVTFKAIGEKYDVTYQAVQQILLYRKQTAQGEPA